MKWFETYFVIFIFYSFIGWIIDCVDVLIEDGKLVNRGFLIGPCCPIYGCGSLLIILTLGRYLNDPVVLFVMSIFICSILEYFTSWLMEKLFKARWWDYSHKKFNLNGRVCLSNVIGFGLGSLIIMYLVQPILMKVIKFINPVVLSILFWLFITLFLLDLIVSFNIIKKFKDVAKSVRKDNTDEITKRVRDILSKEGFLYKRLVSAFNFEASDSLLGSLKKKVENQTMKAKKRLQIEKQKLSLLKKKNKLENKIKVIDEEIKEVNKK